MTTYWTTQIHNAITILSLLLIAFGLYRLNFGEKAPLKDKEYGKAVNSILAIAFIVAVVENMIASNTLGNAMIDTIIGFLKGTL